MGSFGPRAYKTPSICWMVIALRLLLIKTIINSVSWHRAEHFTCGNYFNARHLPPFMLADAPSFPPSPTGKPHSFRAVRITALRANEASHRRTPTIALACASVGMVGNIDAAHGVSLVVFLSFSSQSSWGGTLLLCHWAIGRLCDFVILYTSILDLPKSYRNGIEFTSFP